MDNLYTYLFSCEFFFPLDGILCGGFYLKVQGIYRLMWPYLLPNTSQVGVEDGDKRQR